MQSDEKTANGSWTIGRLLTWTADYLLKRGSENPRLDAEVMLAHVLDWQRVQLYTHYEEVIQEQPRGRFRDLVRRRAEGAPVAYLVGRKEFFSLPFNVSPAVLIPRPESEFVVLEFLQVAKPLDQPKAVDVGTGSGCLAIACTHQHPTVNFQAIDLSPEALAIARGNAERNGVNGRIEFLEGNLLEPVAASGPFDVIVSNPPYLATTEIADLEPGVRDHEPRLALDGGPSGLDLVQRLIQQASGLLKPGGHLILEIGSAQERPVRDLIEAAGVFKLAPTVFDLSKHPRVIRAERLTP